MMWPSSWYESQSDLLSGEVLEPPPSATASLHDSRRKNTPSASFLTVSATLPVLSVPMCVPTMSAGAVNKTPASLG
jgi:hypothetical protein